MKIYQAGPLFSEAEQQWHRAFKARLLSAGYEVIWPYELFSPDDVKAWGEDAPRRIMEADKAALDTCDSVVALLDGCQVDDGTAWEIGYAYARNKPVFGIRTDFRNGGDTRHSCVNAMIEGSCKGIARSVDELLQLLARLA